MESANGGQEWLRETKIEWGENRVRQGVGGCNIPDFYVNQKYEIFKIFQ